MKYILSDEDLERIKQDARLSERRRIADALLRDNRPGIIGDAVPTRPTYPPIDEERKRVLAAVAAGLDAPGEEDLQEHVSSDAIEGAVENASTEIWAQGYNAALEEIVRRAEVPPVPPKEENGLVSAVEVLAAIQKPLQSEREATWKQGYDAALERTTLTSSRLRGAIEIARKEGCEEALKGVVTAAGLNLAPPEGGGEGNYTITSVAAAISAEQQTYKEALQTFGLRGDEKDLIPTSRRACDQLVEYWWSRGLCALWGAMDMDEDPPYEGSQMQVAQAAAEQIKLKHFLRKAQAFCNGEHATLTNAAERLALPEGAEADLESFVKAINNRERSAQSGYRWLTVKYLLEKLNIPCPWTEEHFDLDEVVEQIRTLPGRTFWADAKDWHEKGRLDTLQKICEKLKIDPLAISVEDVVMAIRGQIETVQSETWQDAIREISKDLGLGAEVSTVQEIVKRVEDLRSFAEAAGMTKGWHTALKMLNKELETGVEESDLSASSLVAAINKRTPPALPLSRRNARTLCALKSLQAVLEAKSNRNYPDAIAVTVAHLLDHLRDCPADEPITFLPSEVLPEVKTV